MTKQKTRKTFLGMPMNWDRKNPFKNLWNANNDEIFPPKNFGIGWTINFHTVGRKLGLLPKAKKSAASHERKDRP